MSLWLASLVGGQRWGGERKGSKKQLSQLIDEETEADRTYLILTVTQLGHEGDGFEPRLF